MGKAVNLWVCNAQYWAFLENQLHIMGVRLCCLIPKLLAQQLPVVSYSQAWDFPYSPQWAWTLTVYRTQMDIHTQYLNPEDPSALGISLSSFLQKRILDEISVAFVNWTGVMRRHLENISGVRRIRSQCRERTKDRGNPTGGTSHEPERSISDEQSHWLLWFQTILSRVLV